MYYDVRLNALCQRFYENKSADQLIYYNFILYIFLYNMQLIFLSGTFFIILCVICILVMCSVRRAPYDSCTTMTSRNNLPHSFFFRISDWGNLYNIYKPCNLCSLLIHLSYFKVADFSDCECFWRWSDG